MAGKTARDLIDDEIRTLRRAAGETRGTARERLEADACALERVLQGLAAIKDARTWEQEEAETRLSQRPGDPEWLAIRDAANRSVEMLDRLGAGPDHDDLVAAQAAFAKAYLNTGAEEDEALQHAQFMREQFAAQGMGTGAIAQNLRHEALRYEDM